MNAQANDILRMALSLYPNERAEIAASLIASLDPPKSDDVEAAWAEEIKRRVQSIDNGDVQLIPADEVLRAMRERPHC
jgi:putative addiction module component (TIGR02574 family)